MHWRIHTSWFPKIDKTHQFYSSEKLGKCDYCLTSLAPFHSHYPYSIVNNTPLFPSLANSRLFYLFSLTSDQAEKNRPVALLLKQDHEDEEREAGSSLRCHEWHVFVSPWKRQGAGRRRKKRKNETVFIFCIFFYKSHLQKLGPGRRAAVVHKRAASCRRVEAQWVLAWLKSGNGSLYRTLTWEWDV